MCILTFLVPEPTSFRYIGAKNVYLVMLVSRFFFLMDFGFGSGCPGLDNSAFFKGQKSTLAEVVLLMIPASILA